MFAREKTARGHTYLIPVGTPVTERPPDRTVRAVE